MRETSKYDDHESISVNSNVPIRKIEKNSSIFGKGKHYQCLFDE